MSDDTQPTPRERLEFEVSNKAPRIGTVNGQVIKIERIKLSKIRDAWAEVINIFQAYQVLAKRAIRSDGGGAREGTAATDDTAADDIGEDDTGIFLDQLAELGPDAVSILHKFIQTSSDISDDLLADLDFWSLTELTVMILEHNVGPELKGFFTRGGDALRTLGFLREPPDLNLNKGSSTPDGTSVISGN